ncbi:MAG: hypothetical protein FIA89_08080 [Geobacter sp.]|jgi:RecA-family ATPase|nr:hypothetical protein [Geobacter sp.]
MSTLRIEDNPFAKKLGVKEWHERDLELPKPDEYLVSGVIPANSLVCIRTNGVYGKTTLAMQLAMSIAFNIPFLGRYPVLQSGKVLFLSARDTEDDNYRRFKRLVREWAKIEPAIEQKIEKEITNLTCLSMYDDCYNLPAHLVDVSGSTSKTYSYLYHFIEYYKIKLLILDPVEDFFPEGIGNISEFYRKLRQLKSGVLLIAGRSQTHDLLHGVEIGISLHDKGLLIQNFYAGSLEVPLEIKSGIWNIPTYSL